MSVTPLHLSPQAVCTMRVQLEVVHSKKAQKKCLILKGDTLIGRGSNCNLRAGSPELSREHCRIQVGDASVSVRDLGSVNGTFVNKKQIPPNEDVELAPGCHLVVGPLRFVVHFDAPEPAKPQTKLDETVMWVPPGTELEEQPTGIDAAELDLAATVLDDVPEPAEPETPPNQEPQEAAGLRSTEFPVPIAEPELMDDEPEAAAEITADIAEFADQDAEVAEIVADVVEDDLVTETTEEETAVESAEFAEPGDDDVPEELPEEQEERAAKPSRLKALFGFGRRKSKEKAETDDIEDDIKDDDAEDTEIEEKIATTAVPAAVDDETVNISADSSLEEFVVPTDVPVEDEPVSEGITDDDVQGFLQQVDDPDLESGSQQSGDGDLADFLNQF